MGENTGSVPSSVLQARASLDEAVAWLRKNEPRVPDVAVVLGSGLSPFADTLVNATSHPYGSIPNMPGVGVVGHAGKLVVGELAQGGLDGKKSPVVAALAGRAHFYEGHALDRVVFPVRMLVRWGVKVVVLTNAAGGISPTCRPGDLVLLTDHLNLTGQNPLMGPNDPEFGPRFPDMSEAYNRELRGFAHAAAERAGTQLREGVYAGLTGPTYETPAEIRMLRALGADLVGMSTVPETIAARHMGARVLGISCVTNLASGVSPHPLSHDEVEQTAKATRDRFAKVLGETLRAIPAAERA
jgi:purine-nucleoside phosphorylase